MNGDVDLELTRRLGLPVIVDDRVPVDLGVVIVSAGVASWGDPTSSPAADLIAAKRRAELTVEAAYRGAGRHSAELEEPAPPISIGRWT